jgi:hypothetical protein
MVDMSVQPLVCALYLIVFHIQAVMDSPDHCAWQLGLQVGSSQNSSQQKVLRFPRYAHFHAMLLIPSGDVRAADYTIWRCSSSWYAHFHAMLLIPSGDVRAADIVKKVWYRLWYHTFLTISYMISQFCWFFCLSCAIFMRYCQRCHIHIIQNLLWYQYLMICHMKSLAEHIIHDMALWYQ